MTVAAGTWWEPTYRGGRLESLEVSECKRLLVSSNVGRLGYATADEQRIVPLNYVVFDDHLVFRTSSDNDIARFVPGRPVAFEVDEMDGFLQSGWSVLACGPAEELRAHRCGPWTSVRHRSRGRRAYGRSTSRSR